ncbi:MAG: HD domain-containing protein [Candidatus Omnitrophota bacterium]|jgi:putative nucleotidyltransferase with HDIG domain
MIEKIEKYLKELVVSLQVARIYTTKHPKFEEASSVALISIKDILQQNSELTIGIIGDELAYEREIFFDLSKKIKAAINIFKEKGIERVVFSRGIEKDEFNKFIEFLGMSKDEISGDPMAYFSLLRLKNIIIGKINVSSEAKEKPDESEAYRLHYDESLSKLSNSIEDMIEGHKIESLDLKFTLINVLDGLFSRYQEFLKLTALKRYDEVTFAHLVNVSILAMYFSWKLGYTKEDFLDIATAALFHDIGKIFISRKIIKKPDKLSTGEFAAMKSHTILGAQILLEYSDSLGVIAPVVAFEHHLRYDLKGYPKLRFNQAPHASSLIVSICDVYDALTQRRSYKRDYPPNMIYELMNREKGGLFHPQLLDKFFQIFGVWPLGTILLLSNNNIAIVREQNQDDIFNPIVEIVSPDTERRLLNLKENKTITIEKFLSPLTEGKEYLSLI